MEGGKSTKVARVDASRKISEFFRNSHSSLDKKRDASVQVGSLFALFPTFCQ